MARRTKTPTIAQVLRENLRAIVGAYRAATRASLSAVSKRFYGNANFLQLFFAREHSVSLDKYDAFVDAIRAEWPSGAEWPYLRAALIAPPDPKREG